MKFDICKDNVIVHEGYVLLVGNNPFDFQYNKQTSAKLRQEIPSSRPEKRKRTLQEQR